MLRVQLVPRGGFTVRKGQLFQVAGRAAGRAGPVHQVGGSAECAIEDQKDPVSLYNRKGLSGSPFRARFSRRRESGVPKGVKQMKTTIQRSLKVGLENKTAVITGGAKGIGSAIGLRLARDGANIVILDLQMQEAKKTADDIRSSGVKAAAMECDVTDYEQVRKAVAEAHKEFGSIDILINNAGMDKALPFVETDEALWDKILNVNYRSFLIASHVCVPYMIEQKSGNIVSLGSDAGRIGNPGEVLYCGTKAAIMASSKALAKELARYNIRVNSVSPGPVHTELWDRLHPGEKGQKVTEGVKRVIPMKRLVTPEDVADVVSFFTSEDSRYLTGQVLSIDGGLTMIG